MRHLLNKQSSADTPVPMPAAIPPSALTGVSPPQALKLLPQFPRTAHGKRVSAIIEPMPESECAEYQQLKERETRAHTAWTSFLFRNEVKPKLSDKAKRKHQKEEMEAYQQAHKARLAHAKTCPECLGKK